MEITTDIVAGGVTCVATVIAGVAWLFRLEGRVNTHEQRIEQGEQLRLELREDLKSIREGVEDLRGRQ